MENQKEDKLLLGVFMIILFILFCLMGYNIYTFTGLYKLGNPVEIKNAFWNTVTPVDENLLSDLQKISGHAFSPTEVSALTSNGNLTLTLYFNLGSQSNLNFQFNCPNAILSCTAFGNPLTVDNSSSVNQNITVEDKNAPIVITLDPSKLESFSNLYLSENVYNKSAIVMLSFSVIVMILSFIGFFYFLSKLVNVKEKYEKVKVSFLEFRKRKEEESRIRKEVMDKLEKERLDNLRKKVLKSHVVPETEKESILSKLKNYVYKKNSNLEKRNQQEEGLVELKDFSDFDENEQDEQNYEIKYENEKKNYRAVNKNNEVVFPRGNMEMVNPSSEDSQEEDNSSDTNNENAVNSAVIVQALKISNDNNTQAAVNAANAINKKLEENLNRQKLLINEKKDIIEKINKYNKAIKACKEGKSKCSDENQKKYFLNLLSIEKNKHEAELKIIKDKLKNTELI